MQVSSVFSNYTAPAAFLNRTDLHRLMQESERPSGVFMSVDSKEVDLLYEAVKETPAIAGVLDNNAARKSFKDLIQANTRIMRIVNSIFGVVIAIGVIYNAALIALAESSRDLATLRVIGFSRREVATVLVGEVAIITLLAIPIGLPVGYGFCYLATLAIDTETHRFPLVVSRHTFDYATHEQLYKDLKQMFEPQAVNVTPVEGLPMNQVPEGHELAKEPVPEPNPTVMASSKKSKKAAAAA
jgi:putative ABC transport system permease protein